ncbi:MAG: enoyl-CoA hydratase/isomerase family protein [Salinirussus sp.]
MPQYENLNLDRDDGVATITLDSTAGHNAVTEGMTEELVSVATRLAEDPEARCIVLTHEGDFFGAGADLSMFEGDASDAPTMRALAGRLHEAIVQFHRAEIPVIGGVDGVAAGAGFSLAIFPDLLVLSDAARLEYAYPRIGLTGDGGTTFFLPRLIGLRAAREILLLDDPINPDEAVDMGLATEVVPSSDFDARLTELAEEIAAGPTVALGSTKRLMTESFGQSLEEQLADETEAMAQAVNTADYETGLAAFFTDEEPDFVGR